MVIVASLIALGIAWKITSANDCQDQGGIVIGAMKRMQDCQIAR
jgi:hypothetical protein